MVAENFTIRIIVLLGGVHTIFYTIVLKVRVASIRISVNRWRYMLASLVSLHIRHYHATS